MSLVTQLSTAFTRVGTEFKAIRTLIGGSGTADITSLTTTDKTSLVAAINELDAAPGGGATELDGLSDVTISSPATGQVLRHNGSGQFVNVDPMTYLQPLDSDLTALAALSTTSYGRAVLELADQAAFTALVAASSATVQGKVELATDAETITGTDTARATTPANIAAVITDRIDTTTSLGASNTKVPSQNAVKAYADALIGANDAMVFKGVLDASANPNYPASSRGDTYKISVAGKVGGGSGPNVEVGDVIIALTDGTAAGNHATVGAQWTIVQSNIDGAVVGPASSTASDFATFSGTTGKVIQDSGVTLDTDAALAANSNVRIPSQAAVKSYAQPVDTDLTAIAALTSAADKVPYSTGAAAWSLATFTAAGRALVDDADAAAQRTTLSVYSQTEVGDPTTDFAAVFVAALA